jgi:hypothetical protein
MGTTKTTSSSQATPTPEEQQMEQLQLQQYKANQPALQANQAAGLNLSTNMLQGNLAGLPSIYQGLWNGIDQNQTNAMVSDSLRSLYPQMQGQGLMDSGTMIQAGARTAGDIMNQNAQYNLGTKLNLLNLATGNSAQVQSTGQGYSNQLASQLAGLRSTTTNQRQTNPFMTGQDLMSGIGTGIGTYAAFM